MATTKARLTRSQAARVKAKGEKRRGHIADICANILRDELTQEERQEVLDMIRSLQGAIEYHFTYMDMDERDKILRKGGRLKAVR